MGLYMDGYMAGEKENNDSWRTWREQRDAEYGARIAALEAQIATLKLVVKDAGLRGDHYANMLATANAKLAAQAEDAAVGKLFNNLAENTALILSHSLINDRKYFRVSLYDNALGISLIVASEGITVSDAMKAAGLMKEGGE